MEKQATSKPGVTEEELKALSDAFESQTPQDLLAYALKQYLPGIALACSFGPEDIVLVDMIQRINPRVPLFYLDTDFLFPETYSVRDRIVERYALPPSQVLQVKSLITPDEQEKQYGEALWAREPDRCCHHRKVEPLARVLKNFHAWITGIRRDQTPNRATAGLVEWDAKFDLVKFNPLARWSEGEVWTYIRVHELPYNPLHDQGYPSIGCTHCTAPVSEGEDPRSGRWKNSAKTECGLHKK